MTNKNEETGNFNISSEEEIKTDKFFERCKKCGEVIETTEAYKRGYKKALSLQRQENKIEAHTKVSMDAYDKGIKEGIERGLHLNRVKYEELLVSLQEKIENQVEVINDDNGRPIFGKETISKFKEEISKIFQEMGQ